MSNLPKDPTYVGAFGTLALFSLDDRAVAIDVEHNLVVESGLFEALSSLRDWDTETEVYVPTIVEELAAASLVDLNISITAAASSGDRLYTIPKGAQSEAKKALEWRKEEKRGGTPVGLNTARTLAAGGQIGIKKVRHIAKYFPRHEVDKKGKGWSPGEDNFPSNGRIAWALWGGDVAWRWAQAIVEREDKKKSTTASASPGPDLESFSKAMQLDSAVTPEFIARVRMDGSGIDRLYKVDIDSSTYVWDDGSWDDLGSEDGDVFSYDFALDSAEDFVEKSHIPIDPDSAVIIAAKQHQDPNKVVSISEIDEEEAALVLLAAGELDWTLIDYTLTAAGINATDKIYSPEERSQNASSQMRNALGRFAKQGQSVTVDGDPSKSGIITSTDVATGTVGIQTESGETVNVAAKQTRPKTEGGDTNPTSPSDPTPLMDIKDTPLDVSGILAKPRVPVNQPYARMKGSLPSMTSSDLHDVLYNWASWVQEQRSAYNQGAVTSSGEEESSGKFEEVEAYDHPLLKRWRVQKKRKKEEIAVEEWASPIVAAPVQSGVDKPKELTPKTSDVQPLYFAIVADDDPRAVLDLVSIVPASSVSNAPMTYKRDKGKWVRTEQILNDMRSATPPPVIPLDSETLNDVLLQVDDATVTASGSYSADQMLMVLWGPQKDIIDTYGDAFLEVLDKNQSFEDNLKAVFAVVASGGFDQNRGQAEKLRKYWLHGKGAAKIRWGMHGDWRRCVKHLGKYMGERAKGYCQLRHHESNKFYTGDRRNTSIMSEFIMEEVWGKNIGAPTEITEKDMLMPIEDIMKQQDDIYNDTWTPEPEIVEAIKDISKCSDEEFEALTAAGGLDRNRGNAEKLRRYWTAGPGAAKIRWGMGGDWRRCVKNLTKYMGPRSKGYCALRHKEMTGVWTGDKRNRQMYGKRGNGKSLFSTELINSETQTIENAIIAARADAARERFGVVASSIVESGAKFYIPLLIPEGIESGDGRKFKKNSITMRDLPLPLLWQIKTATGHDGSVVVGKIQTLERVDGGLGNAYGVFDSGPYGREAERLVRNGFIRGISADMDQFEASEDKIEAAENDDDSIKKSKIIINKARVMAATIVPKPAFQECSISILDENYYQNQEDSMIPDGIYSLDELSSDEAEALVACGIIAGAIPVIPPREWFDNPKLQQATPLTVDDSGRVFGHIASWDTNHIGMSYGTKPPRSKSGYAYFHTGVLRTGNGSDVPVGQLTLAGGHASLEASAMEAVRHYDDTASAVADVHAGEDQYGIWVAGSLRPDATPMQIRSLRASAPSGDWRPIRGSLELVAVCQVNVPGFPVARARVASGAIMALVAAGALPLAQMKQDDPFYYLGLDSSDQKKDLTSRVASLMDRMSEFGYISRDTREKLAEKGEALPDGSYPIRNVSDLKNAIQAYGRSNKEDRAKVKKHIIKRARALNVRHLIPENWGSTLSSEDMESVVASLRDRIASFNSEPTKTNSNDLRNRVLAIQEALGKTFAADEFPVDEVLLEGAKDGGDPGTVDFKFTPGKNQPRDIRGRFRQVLARLKENLGESGLQDVNEKIKEVDKITGLGDYKDAARAGNELIKLLDRLDSGSLNKESLENVRKTAAELGKVISNLPLPFKDQAQKVRFSDLPPALQQLMRSMVERVEKKIGKDDAAKATAGVKGFMSGSDVYSQSDISSEMATMLRLLT
jgi:hypothetical protein